MNTLAAYLKSERLNSGLSQQDVADRSQSLTQKQVSRIEIDPLTQDLNSIMDYLNIVSSGKTIEILSMIHKLNSNESAINMITRGIDMQAKLDLEQKIESALNKLKSIENPLLNNPTFIGRIEDIQKNLKNIHTKPIITWFGPSDSGKSTGINFMVKCNLLPAKWQPTTCLVTLVAHENDRPDFNRDAVLVYKVGFQPHMMSDETAQKKYLIESGDISLLKKYASKNENGEMYDESAYMVVTFSDSSILNDIWLLDTPGQLIDHDAVRRQLAGEVQHDLLTDEAKALSAVRLADGIIYASSTTKFLRDDEPGFFSSILRANPPLDGENPLENIIILKTHSYGEIDQTANEQIFREASIHLNKEFGYLLYDSWKSDCPKLAAPSAADWQGVMLPFFKENAEYCKAFDVRLLELIHHLISKRNEYIAHQTQQIKNEIARLFALEKINILDKKVVAVTRTKEVNLKVERFREKQAQLLANFEEMSSSCEQRGINDIQMLTAIFNELVNDESMFNFIDMKFDDKDQAKVRIADAVSAYLENKSKVVLTNSTKLFATELDLIVEKWQKEIPVTNTSAVSLSSDLSALVVGLNYSSFDARSAFVSGLTGLASFGAMAGYVATITSNLGAYILVGEAAGILTTLGITSSVTILPMIVAQTGGPVVWAVTIASLISFLVFKLSADWKKSLARSVVSGMKDAQALRVIRTSVYKYWSDSKIALDKSIEHLKNETELHINAMKADAKMEYAHDLIDNALVEIRIVSKIVS